MQNTAAAGDGDEDRFVVPAAWRRVMHPRRDAGQGHDEEPQRHASEAEVRVPAHTGSTAPMEALCAAATATGEPFIGNTRNTLELAQALKAQLAGHPSPTGAAGLALVAKHTASTELTEHLDAWITGYGLPFAAEATLETARIGVADTYYRTDPFLTETSEAGLRPDRRTVFRQLRAYLTKVDDATYAQVVSVLGRHRSDLRGRVLVAYLVPTERAWVAEACAAAGKGRARTGEWRPLVALLQCSVRGAEELAALRTRKQFQVDHTDLGLIATLAAALGPASVELFPPLLDRRWANADVRRPALEVLARIPGDEAFAVMAARLTMKHVQAAAIDASGRFPRRAIRLLAAAACERTGVGRVEHTQADEVAPQNAGAPCAAADLALDSSAAVAAQGFPSAAVHRALDPSAAVAAQSAPTENALAARALLAGHLARHADLVAAVRPSLTRDERALVDQLSAQVAGRPVAAVDALPDLLVNPPWTRKRPRPTLAASAIDVPPAPAICRIDWLPGERDAFNRGTNARSTPRSDPDWQPILKEIEARGITRHDDQLRAALLQAPEPDARRALAQLRSGFEQMDQAYAFGPLLVRFDTDAIDAVLYRSENRSLTHRAALLQPIVDIRVARLMADWLLRPGGSRPPARTWLARHREEAAILLIPDAVGADKLLRPAAETALRHLDAAVGLDVASIAERIYGQDAAARVKAIVEADPLELVPARAPKLAEWLRETHLPQILLQGRQSALPEEAVRHVLTMLAISKPGEPYAGLEVVKELTDPTSLAEFGRALFAAWRAKDYTPKEAWIMPAQAILGDVSTVCRLAPLISAWPRENGYQRALAGLEVLVAFGTDEALLHLYRIGRSAASRSLRERAEEKFAHLAAERGLTTAQFADRLVPDLGLDARGTLWLDYGPRRFRATIDASGLPELADETGAPLAQRQLPEPAPEDDIALAEAAQERLKVLIEEAKAVVAHVTERMESAMTARRTWPAAAFRALITHPLIGDLTRRVVWLTYVDGVATPLRIAEDGGFADVDDQAAFALPEQATLGVAHPVQLGEKLAAWSELFADYEIIQPFPQLGRPVYARTAAERAGASMTRFIGVTVPAAEVRALHERGWQREHPPRYGAGRRLVRPTPDGRWLILAFTPSERFGTIETDTPQRLAGIGMHDAPQVSGPTDPLELKSLDDLDPITTSELLGDLSRMTR